MLDDWAINTVRRASDRAVVEAQARAAYQANRDFLALPAPTYPLNSAAQQALVTQVAALTRQVNALARLVVEALLDAPS